MASRKNSIRFSFASYEANAGNYDNTYGNLNDYKGEADFIRYIVESRGIAIGPYMEFGCGTGALIQNLKVFPKKIGVDISEELLKIAASKAIPGADFHQGDLMDYDFPEERFVTINVSTYILQTSESIDDMSRFILSAKTHLVEGGFLMFSWIDERAYSLKYSDGQFSCMFDGGWEFRGNTRRLKDRRELKFVFFGNHGRTIGSEAEYLILTSKNLRKLSEISGMRLEIHEGLGNGLKEPYQKYAILWND